MRKQLFYLTNNQLSAYSWGQDGISAAQEFSNDKAGWEAFSGYLASRQNVPAYLVADLIEEAFQRDTIPHLYGKSRTTLIKRRLSQLYRDTPYRQGTIQGREKEGRKDDQIIFSALTNAALPKPWADAILVQKVPLAGIYSLALLSATLFQKLGLSNEPLLLVTHQSSGLRQSYFQDGTLRFSRLTPLSDLSPAAIADTVTSEIGKTRQFLASTRQLPVGAQIQIVIMANEGYLPALQEACLDTVTVLHSLIGLQEAAQLLKLKNLNNITTCDPIFLSLLGIKAPASHYQLFEQSRFYKLWQARSALYWLSAATLIAGVLWTGVNVVDALNTKSKNQKMDAEIRHAEARYQKAVDTMPATIAKPQNMKAAVEVGQMVAQNAPEPVVLLGLISRALDKLPEIRIDQLQWQVSETAPAAAGSEAATPPPAAIVETAPAVALIGIPKKPFQILMVEGEIDPFKNDYRAALESVRQLKTELAKNKQLQVEVTQWPIDIGTAVKLDGQAGNKEATASAKASFILKLVWNP